jgi:hypothetical protein
VGGSRERDGPAGGSAATRRRWWGASREKKRRKLQGRRALDKELSAFNEERCAFSPF